MIPLTFQKLSSFLKVISFSDDHEIMNVMCVQLNASDFGLKPWYLSFQEHLENKTDLVYLHFYNKYIIKNIFIMHDS